MRFMPDVYALSFWFCKADIQPIAFFGDRQRLLRPKNGFPISAVATTARDRI